MVKSLDGDFELQVRMFSLSTRLLRHPIEILMGIIRCRQAELNLVIKHKPEPEFTRLPEDFKKLGFCINCMKLLPQQAAVP